MPKIIVHALSLFLVASACANGCNPFADKSIGPENVVEAYLDIAFNMKDVAEKKNLMSLTTGSLKAALSSATDETIKAAYIDRRYDLQSYSVIQRRDRTPRETEITFQLTYRDLGNTAAKDVNAAEAATVTTENTVALIKEQGVWLIREVLGHKTTIDFPVSEAAQISAKPGVITEDGSAEEDEADDAAADEE